MVKDAPFQLVGFRRGRRERGHNISAIDVRVPTAAATAAAAATTTAGIVVVEAYLAVPEACAADRLNGARASEPARKILEDMATFGYEIPVDLANACVMSTLGEGAGATHDGFGGINAALAMVSAVETSPGGTNALDDATYSRLATSLARERAVEESMLVLRSMVVERSFTPPLGTFADVAKVAAQTPVIGGGDHRFLLALLLRLLSGAYFFCGFCLLLFVGGCEGLFFLFFVKAVKTQNTVKVRLA